jgi:hypothetical protein
VTACPFEKPRSGEEQGGEEALSGFGCGFIGGRHCNEERLSAVVTVMDVVLWGGSHMDGVEVEAEGTCHRHGQERNRIGDVLKLDTCGLIATIYRHLCARHGCANDIIRPETLGASLFKVSATALSFGSASLHPAQSRRCAAREVLPREIRPSSSRALMPLWICCDGKAGGADGLREPKRMSPRWRV